MLDNPMDVLRLFPVRKNKQQKQAFRDAVQDYAKSLGYESTVEEGSFGARNIVIGDPEKAKYLVTAHYDTPASIGLPNILTPCNFLTYLLWQLLVVGILLLITFLLGVGTYLLTHSRELVLLICYVFYFGVLVLLMFGPANKSNANDNTSGVVTVLETARTMPEMYRDKVCFVLFDLEEAGLIGSAAFSKKHKQSVKDQIVLNLDCVGDGDHIIFFPTKKAKKNEALMTELHRIGGWFGDKNVLLKKDGFYTYPSDQKNFPVGIGIAAFSKKQGIGYYVDKIHTEKDTVLDETNVNILRAALTTLICGKAVQ